MTDPMARVVGNRPPDLFNILAEPDRNSTRTQGQIAADRTRNDRFAQILDLLRERGPLANWQIAEALQCQPHQTSGRLAELRDQGKIENTGERRKNPRTNVSGEVVRLVDTIFNGDLI